MVLKRFLTMALGALGLGALAAGTASGQGETPGMGNIPAPDIFDDQITCIMNVPSAKETPMPTVIPMGGMDGSRLDMLIGDDGRARLPIATLKQKIAEAAGGPLMLEDDEQILMDLGYVIPPMGANCGGAGTDTMIRGEGPFNAVTVGMAAMGETLATRDYDPGEGDIATDVAHGYSELLGKFVAVYGKPDDPEDERGGTARVLEAAQKVVTDTITAGNTPSASQLKAVELAQKMHDEAMTAFTDASAGPIYQAGVVEWKAKAAVTQAIVDYDEAVTGHIMENRGMIETNAGDILTNAGNISMNSGRIDANEMGIASNASSIASNASMIGSNSASISDNRTMIGELSESLEVVRAGVAASMALAGMPAINGRGISIGVGSFDGESAFAVGFQIQGEMASFKVGLTSGGGATGASAGVGFQF